MLRPARARTARARPRPSRSWKGSGADGGRGRGAGHVAGTRDEALRERIGVALQETRLPERLSVGEMLQLFRSFYAGGSGLEVDALLADVELTEKRDAWVEEAVGRAAAAAGGRAARWSASRRCCSSTSRRPASIRSRGAQLWDLVLRFRGTRAARSS